MNGKRSYDQQLRLIGQSLEARRINIFELKADGDRYIVRGDPEKSPSLKGQALGSSMSYALADFEQLDRQARLRRRKPNGLPDSYSLSNTLRTVGSYLDRKGAELLEIHKRPLSLTILYQNQDGHPDMEERTIASFYNLFIDLYGKRGRKN